MKGETKMKHLITSPAIAALTLLFFALSSFASAPKAHAAWRDRSDELPGMSKFPTGLVVAGVVIVGAAITYAVVKHHKKQESHKTAPAVTDPDQGQKQDSSAQKSSVVDPKQESARSTLSPVSSKWSPCVAITGLRGDPLGGTRFNLSKVGVNVGIKISL
jgi:hypothetical protein